MTGLVWKWAVAKSPGIGHVELEVDLATARSLGHGRVDMKMGPSGHQILEHWSGQT